jgi:hypothetical protein
VFKWTGNFYGLLLGTHQFYFIHSQESPGNTLLIQKEDFTGPLSILFKQDWSSEKQTKGNFEEFNRDIKAAAERAAR